MCEKMAVRLTRKQIQEQLWGAIRSGGIQQHGTRPARFLGFIVSAFVSKVRGRKDRGGDRDDDVARLFTMGDAPLNDLVSDRQSSSSESDILPPAWGWVGHQEGGW